MPDILNWFGRCTWDAFYTNVTAEGVKEGLQRSLLILQCIPNPKSYHIISVLRHPIYLFFIFSFQKGGVSPKFVIIDDGWQSVAMDPVGIACLADNSAK